LSDRATFPVGGDSSSCDDGSAAAAAAAAADDSATAADSCNVKGVQPVIDLDEVVVDEVKVTVTVKVEVVPNHIFLSSKNTLIT
jgi:hypothetical protein